MFGIEIKDIIDILLVAVLLHQTYRLMKNTGTSNIFVGILSFIVFWFLIVHVFKLELMSTILNQLISVGAIVVVVIFQNEIRNFFSQIGSRKTWKFYKKLHKYFKKDEDHEEDTSLPVMNIVMACKNMSNSRTGALIVIEKENNLQEYISTGDTVNADISTRMIESIFFKNSPLHDGAVVISNNRIKAAGTILPVSKSLGIPRNLGLRHRAAMGLSEKTDAIIVIVSEETGAISIAMNGKFYLDLDAQQIEKILSVKTK